MNRLFSSSTGTNVNGNFKSKAKQHIKTGKKFLNKKVIPSAAKNYKNYIAPTVGLFKGAANIATGVGKMALRSLLREESFMSLVMLVNYYLKVEINIYNG